MMTAPPGSELTLPGKGHSVLTLDCSKTGHPTRRANPILQQPSEEQARGLDNAHEFLHASLCYVIPSSAGE